MKTIWDAILTLETNNKQWYTRFNFVKMGENYKDCKDYWKSESVGDIIPKQMKIVNGIVDPYIEQGFERELSEEELKLLEIEMKVKLKEYLTCKKERINQAYENMIKSIKF
ncbi:hypothetical protein ACSXEK_15970 (plasmid) [Clostridium perfringens]